MLTDSGTSKYHSQEASLGSHGTFLASLAAMSLLTITSHHCQHRSTNSVTLHHAQAIDRQLPASTHCQVHAKHGTRVTVRNLFGNLPVRIKHQSMLLEQKLEHDRLWGALRKNITALLLSWQGTVALRVRDSNNAMIFSFNISKPTTEIAFNDKDTVKPRSRQLSSMLSTLTQANYIIVDEWASWVPASASTGSLSVKGAISLQPAPSKNVQFISLGIRPLLAESGRNELFDAVNRLFALSSFGMIEDDADIDESEIRRRQSNKRYKDTGYTNRQLRGRKDVDRYPMFNLRILPNSSKDGQVAWNDSIEDETNLQTVIEVVSAMITQWLSVHHFRPRLPRKKHARPGTTSTSTSETTDGDSPTLSGNDSTSAFQSKAQKTSRTSLNSLTSGRKKRLAKTSLNELSDRIQHRAFAEWSRIKSGRADFFSTLSAPSKPASAVAKANSQAADGNDAICTGTEDCAGFEVEPIPLGAFSHHTVRGAATEFTAQSLGESHRDDTIIWVDPSTKKSHVLNARTGCVVPTVRSRPHTDSAVPMLAEIQRDQSKPLRLAPNSATAGSGNSPWLDDMLRSWDNPIFKPSEQQIPQALVLGQDTGNSCNHGSSHHSHPNINQAFHDLSISNPSRLSKGDLRRARVIAQVDRKFILAKMHTSSDSDSTQDPSSELLVLIDQHAADERVQVETLFKELCTPPSDTSGGIYCSKLGHTSQIASVILEKPLQFSISDQEQRHFTSHAARFAAWGILYDVVTPASASQTSTPATKQPLLSVTTLPPAISSRCTADPKLLISLLRSTVWQFASDPHLPPLASPVTALDADTDTTSWVRRLATCPPALVDMVNSRACRSAIMFNDALSHAECEELVQKLARCVFPFMCAHGRPSMVPLVSLGQVVPDESRSGDGRAEEIFVHAWKRWRSDKC